MLDAKKLLDAFVGSLAASPPGAGSAQVGAPAHGDASAHENAPAGGISDLLGGVIGQLTGGTPSQAGSIADAGSNLINQARQYLDTPEGRNIASAVTAGLAGLLVGSRASGKSITSSAARLGGVALIGGLAYKAYQGWKSGQPAWADSSEIPAPPQDSAFGPDAISQDTALVLTRAMIAAAASDGHVDTEERGRIVGNLTKAGFQAEAATFLDREFANPVSITQLASAASSEELAVQIFVAARLAIEPDTEEERAFLRELAEALSLSPALVGHIDAGANSAKA